MSSYRDTTNGSNEPAVALGEHISLILRVDVIAGWFMVG
jgi:hypothetical protein